MRELSFDESRALELYAQGMPDKEIAADLGVRSGAISSWRSRRGLSRNLPPLQHGTRPEVTVDIPPGVFPCGAPREAHTQEIPAGG